MVDDFFKGMWAPATWAGAFISGIGALTITEWMAVGGFVLAVLGFCVNAWHKFVITRIAIERARREASE